MNARLDNVMEEIRGRAERDRVDRLRKKMREISTAREPNDRPLEDPALRRPGVSALSEVLAIALPMIAENVSVGARLEAIDRELHELLANQAPAEYAEHRRALVQIMRRIRRAVRARERSAPPLS